MKALIQLCVVFAFLVGGAGIGLGDCGICGDSAPNILGKIHDSRNFNKLHRALHEVHLARILAGEGPITLFAPNDEAFEKLPPAALEELFADKELLRRADDLKALVGHGHGVVRHKSALYFNRLTSITVD